MIIINKILIFYFKSIGSIVRSRTDFDAEYARIKIKFRTRLTRAKKQLRKTNDWNTISQSERESRENQVQIELDQQQKKELESMAVGLVICDLARIFYLRRLRAFMYI